MDDGTLARVFYLSIILCALIGWMLVEYRGRFGVALRAFMAWVLIFVGVMAGYGLWTDLQRDVGREAVMVGDGLRVPRSGDGHYHVTLTISGEPVDFMVDTGATNVVLSQRDAMRLGINPNDLAYLGRAETANGSVRTARVRIEDVSLGPWHDDSISARVNEGEMEGSLLGMDYLDRFHVEIAGDEMILRR